MKKSAIHSLALAGAATALLLAAGCTGYNQRTSPGVWNGGHQSAPAAPIAPPVAPPRPAEPFVMEPVTAAPMVQRGSVTAGCDGSWTRYGADGARVAGGRAHNTGSGLVAIDRHGRHGAAITSATSGGSLVFQPDCNCPSVRQMADAGGAAPMCVAG